MGTRSQVELVVLMTFMTFTLHVRSALHVRQMPTRSAGVVSEHSTSGAVSPVQGLLH